jgi:hypothetical protein
MKGKKLYVVKVNGYWLGYAGLEAEISDCKLYQGDPSKQVSKWEKKYDAYDDVEVYMWEIGEDMTFSTKILNEEYKEDGKV